jgi:hypothetical protein
MKGIFFSSFVITKPKTFTGVKYPGKHGGGPCQTSNFGKFTIVNFDHEDSGKITLFIPWRQSDNYSGEFNR